MRNRALWFYSKEMMPELETFLDVIQAGIRYNHLAGLRLYLKQRR